MSDTSRKTERVTFRLTAEEASRLASLAAREKVNPSVIVRRALARLFRRAA